MIELLAREDEQPFQFKGFRIFFGDISHQRELTNTENHYRVISHWKSELEYFLSFHQ